MLCNAPVRGELRSGARRGLRCVFPARGRSGWFQSVGSVGSARWCVATSAPMRAGQPVDKPTSPRANRQVKQKRLGQASCVFGKAGKASVIRDHGVVGLSEIPGGPLKAPRSPQSARAVALFLEGTKRVPRNGGRK